MILYAYILVSLLILFFVAEPLLRSSIVGAGGVSELEGEERTQALLQSLKKLYLNQQDGQIYGDDFNNIERRLLLELAKVYRGRGIDPNRVALPQGEADDHCECGVVLGADYQFCPACGRRKEAA